MQMIKKFKKQKSVLITIKTTTKTVLQRSKLKRSKLNTERVLRASNNSKEGKYINYVNYVIMK